MAGTAQPNYPQSQKHVLTPVKVRQLQNRLWATAKQSPGRRFHALYDRIYRSDVLWAAWERVRANRGAAGVDGVTLAAVETYGAERMLTELQESLRAGIYRPVPVRRVEIPKPDGSKRPLGIPTVKGQGVPAGGQGRPRTDIRGRFLALRATGFARSGRPPTPWSGAGKASSGAASSSSRPISGTSSARLTMSDFCRWWASGVSDRRVLKLLQTVVAGRGAG